ncbi:GSCOCG00010547001-RA-CDS, partial [Cotesia congregata]
NRAWLLDSGCTAHLCGDQECFKSMSESSNIKLILASQASTQVKGKGVVHLPVSSSSGYKVYEFKDTLYVPDLRTNLISVAKITNKEHEVTFRRNDAYVRDEHGNINVIADRKGDLYVVREGSECAEAAVQYGCSELLKWHARLGHLNVKDL